MKKAIFYCLLTFLILIKCFGQNFEYLADSPFGIEHTNGPDTLELVVKYVFHDMDHDQDLDLILLSFFWDEEAIRPFTVTDLRYVIEMQENIGNRVNPQFSDRHLIFRDFIFPNGDGFFVPAVDDINGDGLVDFLISAEVDSNLNQFPLFYLQDENEVFNISRCTEWNLPAFPRLSFFIPEIVDLDMDGDKDIMMNGYYAPIQDPEKNENIFLFAKNHGSSTEPAYWGWFDNPYGLEPDTFPIHLIGGDLDLDGDVDFLGLGLNNPDIILNYYENQPGEDNRPSFIEPVVSPFGLPVANPDEQFFFPSLVDIDGDGDLDFFLPVVIDSLVKLDFYINTHCETAIEELEITICEGDSYIVGEQAFDEAGIYVIQTQLQNACIQNTQLTLEILPNVENEIFAEICEGESYLLDGDNLNETGIYELGLMSQSGCDSIVILDLVVYPVYQRTETASLCEGEAYIWEGESYEISGNYQANYQSIDGCDSLLYLNLEVYPVSIQEFDQEICEGESFMIGAEVFDQTGSYELFLMDQNDCDSIIYLNLLVHPDYESIETANICEGESFEWHGQSYTESGVYTVSFGTIYDCDSILFLDLTVDPFSSTHLEESLCLGDEYFIGPELFSASGIYEVTLKNQFDCDSLITANLTFIELDTTILKDGGVLYAKELPEYSYQWFDCNSEEDIAGANSFNFEAPYSGTFAVKLSNELGCESISACYLVIATNTNKNALKSLIEMIPNPTAGSVFIRNLSRQEIASIEVMSISGERIVHFKGNRLESLDLSALKQGLYMIKFNLEESIVVKEVIKVE